MRLPLKVAIGLMTSPGAEGHDGKLVGGWGRDGLTTSDISERDGSPEEKRKKKEEEEKTSCGTRTFRLFGLG